MKSARYAILFIISILIAFNFATALYAAPAKKGLFEQLELPLYPGAKVVREINWPPAKSLTTWQKSLDQSSVSRS